MQLAGYEEDAYSGTVGDDNGTGDEPGDFPEIEKPSQELDDTDEERKVDGEMQGGEPDSAVGGDRRRNDEADRAGRPENVVPGREEKSTDEPAHDHRNHDRGRGQVQDEGKTDCLGYRNQGHRCAGGQIGPKLGPGVGAQFRHKRKAHPEHVRTHGRDAFGELSHAVHDQGLLSVRYLRKFDLLRK